jgi:hypothetical protein
MEWGLQKIKRQPSFCSDGQAGGLRFFCRFFRPVRSSANCPIAYPRRGLHSIAASQVEFGRIGISSFYKHDFTPPNRN